MKDWQKRLIKRVVEEMRAGKDCLPLWNYSEGMMWYSDERLLEIAPGTKIYKLSNAALFDINDNLYIRTPEGFDLLGKASDLCHQLHIEV